MQRAWPTPTVRRRSAGGRSTRRGATRIDPRPWRWRKSSSACGTAISWDGRRPVASRRLLAGTHGRRPRPAAKQKARDRPRPLSAPRRPRAARLDGSEAGRAEADDAVSASSFLLETRVGACARPAGGSSHSGGGVHAGIPRQETAALFGERCVDASAVAARSCSGRGGGARPQETLDAAGADYAGR